MRLIIVTGLSGSGKSIALHTLEDLGFYALDNLPVALLPAFVDFAIAPGNEQLEQIAVGIDARSSPDEVRGITDVIEMLKQSGTSFEVIYLQADNPTLIKRFSETRRKHPLAQDNIALQEAIDLERELVAPLASRADLFIDTTYTNVHELRDLVRLRVLPESRGRLSLLFKSFGFKRGIPNDVDFVFDVRCLPNPHWEPRLRDLTGRDADVANFLSGHAEVSEMLADISTFLERWIPRFKTDNRPYLSIGIGCTGGQHRSVYMAELLAERFSEQPASTMVRHRDLA